MTYLTKLLAENLEKTLDIMDKFSLDIVRVFYQDLYEQDIDELKYLIDKFPKLKDILSENWIADMQFFCPEENYDSDNNQKREYTPYFPSIELLELLKDKTNINAIITDISNPDNISSVSEYISSSMHQKNKTTWKYSGKQLNLVALAYKEKQSKDYIHEIYKLLSDRQLGFYPLHYYAQYGGTKDIIEAIIEGENITDVNIRTNNIMRRSPLHVAVNANNIDIAKLLIEEYHADVNIIDGFGKTPLDIATENDNDTMIKLLTENGAVVNNDFNNKSETDIPKTFVKYNVSFSKWEKDNLSKRQLVNQIVHHWFNTNNDPEERREKLAEFNELRKAKDGLKGYANDVLRDINSLPNDHGYDPEAIVIDGVEYLVNLNWGDPGDDQRDCFYDFMQYAEYLGYNIEILDDKKWVYLNRMGSSWFVSFLYYMTIDKTHNNWEITDNQIRKGYFEKTRKQHFHKEYLEKILKSNELLLGKNQINLTGHQIKEMAETILDNKYPNWKNNWIFRNYNRVKQPAPAEMLGN